jgi:hypothetical protein
VYSHIHHTLLKRGPMYLLNCVCISWEVLRNVDCEHSAVSLCPVTSMASKWCISQCLQWAYPVTQSTSITPLSPYTHCWSLQMYLDAVIDRVERYTCRLRPSELRDALGDHDEARLEIHWEARIERVWRSTLGP